MALSDPYAFPAEYRARIKPNTDDEDDDLIMEDLIAVSRYLEGELDRFFNKDDSPQEIQLDVPVSAQPAYFPAAQQYYASTPYPVVCIETGDLAELPSVVKVDLDKDGTFETTLAGDSWECHPLNAALQPEAEPYTTLVPRKGMLFQPGTRLQLTVIRGWPVVPVGVKVKTIQLTALLRLESDRATRRIPTDIDTVVETSYDAMRIVRELTAKYKKSWFLM